MDTVLLQRTLKRMGLVRSADEIERLTALPGGVSSDIVKVDLAAGCLCVKRALERLKVDADWRVSVARNAFEVRWYETVAALVPGAAPRVRGHDAEHGLFAMDYLDPATHVLWKEKLRRGDALVADAEGVGERLGTIHALTADAERYAALFASDEIFRAIRLDAYLGATARMHPDLAVTLERLAADTATHKAVVVHGDVSPKNILLGPEGPVFLDAECAWFGDPAFDVAFCLNHLLLKCLWVPRAARALLDCFAALEESYVARVSWETPAALRRRAARLLPGLFLARVDGKSPVEYLENDAARERVRRTARALLREPVGTPGEVAAAWAAELGL